MDISSFLIGYEAGKNSVASGGGGGSLPAGVYWKPMNIPYKNKNRQRWFVFNGSLYVAVSTATNQSYFEGIYKYNGTTWTTIISGQNASNPWVSYGGFNYIEYHGKLHMTNYDTKDHATFDGTSVTTMNALPSSASYWAMFVQGDLLKYYSVKDGKTYVWNEADDTWGEESDTGMKFTYLAFTTINGTTYAWSNKKIYIYDGTSLTEIATWPTSSPSVAEFGKHGNCIYLTSSQSSMPHSLVEFNTQTQVARVVGTLPYCTFTFVNMFSFDGKLCCVCQLGSDYFGVNALYEVTE